MGLPSFLARARSPSHTVEILCKLAWHVIVDDGLNPLDVQTTGSQVCGHEVIDVPVTELLERFQPLSIYVQLWCLGA